MAVKGFHIITGFLLLLCTGFPEAQAQTSTLTVQVTQIKSTKGKVLFALFNGADGFPGTHQKAFKLMEAIPAVGTTTIRFENLPEGTYALAVFHDENKDGKLNTNLVGIPKEPYGFSNNARPAFSAPSFKEASFVFKNSKTLSIEVK
jgi:uncharacterized protein (DUF2141 family)